MSKYTQFIAERDFTLNQPIQTEATYYKNRNIKAIEVWGTNRHLSASRSSNGEFLRDFSEF